MKKLIMQTIWMASGIFWAIWYFLTVEDVEWTPFEFAGCHHSGHACATINFNNCSNTCKNKNQNNLDENNFYQLLT